MYIYIYTNIYTCIYMWHDSFFQKDRHSFTCVTWLIHMLAKTHSHAWYDRFVSATWLRRHDYMHQWYMLCILYTWHDHMYQLYMRQPQNDRDRPSERQALIHMCSIGDVFCMALLIHMHTTTQSHTIRLICMQTWLRTYFHAWLGVTRRDSTHLYTWHHYVWWWVMTHIAMNRESCHVCQWIVWRMPMNHVTHGNESCHTWECIMVRMW